jgi:hypothetical protein
MRSWADIAYSIYDNLKQNDSDRVDYYDLLNDTKVIDFEYD